MTSYRHPENIQHSSSFCGQILIVLPRIRRAHRWTRVVWSIVTVEGSYAVRYYAAMCDAAMRIHVTDRLLYAECCMLGSQGITDYDLMGIGSDFAPSLKGLNAFKTKFTETITPVAPARDVPLKKVFYKTLQAVQGVRRAFRQ